MYVSYFFVYHPATVDEWWNVDRVTVDMLPDVVLLKIFDFYVNQARELEYKGEGESLKVQEWHTLVHVCRQWRTIVLGSPRRLGLRLLCTDRTPVKEMLAIWPPLPIVVQIFSKETRMDNIVVALEHNERICEIVFFNVTKSQMKQVLAAVQQPFPALTRKVIWSSNWVEMPPVVPESFLGGSAPSLQYLDLLRIPFPGLPNLLLSATDLVTLLIRNVSHSGHISPEVMVSCLSTLTRLDYLWLEFKSPGSRPVQVTRHPPRSTLPALAFFLFEGVSEYLEDLVARIDAPLLDYFDIRFSHRLMFDTPQLAQFLARTPSIQPLVAAFITFFDRHVRVTFSPPPPIKFDLVISCRHPDWQLSSLSQVFRSSFPDAFISTVEQLFIRDIEHRQPNEGAIEDGQWLEVLSPFTAVKDLYLSREFAPRIFRALQELAGEVFPSLQKIFLEGGLHPSWPVEGAIEKFVAARQLANQPVAVSRWDKEKDKSSDLEVDD